jgi:hypothetical protein
VIPALDRSLLKRQLNHSPGLAKIAPYLPCHRDNFPAKGPGQVAGCLRQVTLTAHTHWPLRVMLSTGYKNQMYHKLIFAFYLQYLIYDLSL